MHTTTTPRSTIILRIVLAAVIACAAASVSAGNAAETFGAFPVDFGRVHPVRGGLPVAHGRAGDRRVGWGRSLRAARKNGGEDDEKERLLTGNFHGLQKIVTSVQKEGILGQELKLGRMTGSFHDAVHNRKPRQAGHIVEIQFLHHVCSVAVSCLYTDSQLGGNLFRAVALRN